MMRLAKWLALLSVAAIAGCDILRGGQAKGGGGGFEGETITLAGQILNDDIRPAVGASVRLRSSGFLAGESTNETWNTVTGSDGRFSIADIPEGSYVLESFDSNSNSAQRPIQVQPSTKPDSLVRIPPDTLRPMGALLGRIVLDSRSLAPIPEGTVQVVGLARSATIGADGTFLLSNLPAGEHSIQISFPALGTGRKETGILVTSGDTASLEPIVVALPLEDDLSAWEFSRKINLNTTASGANVTGNVHDFPLLVRLDSTHIDFSRVSHPADGADIRFCKADGTPLPFETEYWDAAGKKAVFWVRMDTVLGNRSDQSFLLKWGRKEALGVSQSRSVFDSANGFAGIWHFSGDNAFVDATGRQARARNHTSSGRTGVIGTGRYFDFEDAVEIPDAPSLKPSSFTLSCWAKREGNQVRYAKFFFKGSPGTPYASYTMDMRLPGGGVSMKVTFSDSSDNTASSPDAVQNNAWFHAASTYDAASGTGSVFINGVLSKSFVQKGTLYYPADARPLFIGNESGTGIPEHSFNGYLDEARVSEVARSLQWLRLDYESQKPGGKLLEFK